MRISISSIAADPERKNRAMLEEGRVAGHARSAEASGMTKAAETPPSHSPFLAPARIGPAAPSES